METVQIAAIVVRTEKTFRFMSIRFSAVRQYCCYSKTPTGQDFTFSLPLRRSPVETCRTPANFLGRCCGWAGFQLDANPDYPQRPSKRQQWPWKRP
jgi:hypothetical protein